MDIRARIQDVKDRIAAAAGRSGRDPRSVTLLAVTKTFPVEALRQAHAAGLRLFGENRVQEALVKQPLLPADIEWHLIGQLQTNKINKVLGRFGLIQSVDSLHLAKALSARLTEDQEVLLEVNTSGEASKAGFAPQELPRAFDEALGLPRLKVRGLMTVGPLTQEGEARRRAFRTLRSLFDGVKGRAPEPAAFSILSMGMSGDFEEAIEEGSTLVRVGSALFGERPAPKKD
ncbi:MAG TPA: YggS family pyridoxal phosphate-dependent enzyme [bacterium]|nr:YggS family pyridoxal phosphate-dependent enzyme [bacterium]